MHDKCTSCGMKTLAIKFLQLFVLIYVAPETVAYWHWPRILDFKLVQLPLFLFRLSFDFCDQAASISSGEIPVLFFLFHLLSYTVYEGCFTNGYIHLLKYLLEVQHVHPCVHPLLLTQIEVIRDEPACQIFYVNYLRGSTLYSCNVFLYLYSLSSSSSAYFDVHCRTCDIQLPLSCAG